MARFLSAVLLVCAAAVVAEEVLVASLAETQDVSAKSWADKVIGGISDDANTQRKPWAVEAQKDLSKVSATEGKASQALADLESSSKKLMRQPIINQNSVLDEDKRIESDIAQAEAAEDKQFDWLVQTADALSGMTAKAGEEDQLGETKDSTSFSSELFYTQSKKETKSSSMETSRADKAFDDVVIQQELAAKTADFVKSDRAGKLDQMMTEAQNVAMKAGVPHGNLPGTTEWHVDTHQPTEQLGEASEAAADVAVEAEEKVLEKINLQAHTLKEDEGKEMDFIDYLVHHLQTK